MSIFPTRILLATDGSRQAQLAATTAADLARSTASELHVLYVGEAANPYVDVVRRQAVLRSSQRLRRTFRRSSRCRITQSLSARTRAGTLSSAHLRWADTPSSARAPIPEAVASMRRTKSSGNPIRSRSESP